jgi:hypothetical protein
MPQLRITNSAQVLSCKLKFVHALAYYSGKGGGGGRWRRKKVLQNRAQTESGEEVSFGEIVSNLGTALGQT